MPRFSAEERAENTAFVVEEHAKGRSYSEIARELSVDRRTVKGWIEAEYARRSEHRGVSDAREQAIARYEMLFKDCIARLGALGKDSRSLNASGYINAARGLQERIDKLTGAEAPVKFQAAEGDYEVVWHDIDPSEGFAREDQEEEEEEEEEEDRTPSHTPTPRPEDHQGRPGAF